MKRKIIALCLVIAMLGVAIISGTMAYFTDTAEAVNVMTLGKVDIELIEEKRPNDQVTTVDPKNMDTLDPNTGYHVVPAVYLDGITWQDNTVDPNLKIFNVNMKNVFDKFVSVKNTGRSDAYVRIFFAFEDSDKGLADKLHISFTNDAYFAPVEVVPGEVLHTTINGELYEIYSYTYADPIKPGEQSEYSLKQFFFNKTTTNEDVAAAGDEYTILVLAQAIQADGFKPEVSTLSNDPTIYATKALNEGFGDPIMLTADTTDEADLLNVEAWFGAMNFVDRWDGTADKTWYNDTDTEFAITTAEQLAGFAELVDEGKTFEGKTVKLGADIDLYVMDANGEAVCFDPIGSYQPDKSFKGTFDGQGHTIMNLSQNTWALDNGLERTECGLGLFGQVKGATIKNLTVDGAGISGEHAMVGIVAAAAYNSTFENITVKNSKGADYEYYAGGIVGWATGKQMIFTNCNVEASTTIAAQWGDFNNASGGLIGGAGPNAEILVKDTTIACRIDAYNDVTSAYEWYAYRRSGMIIGDTGVTVEIGETTYAAAPQLTCENVTVIYGDWANYTYCEFEAMGYPFVRVQAGISNSAYSNPRYGHPTDANGNEVVDDNHVHNDGEKHQILCVFDQLYGGQCGDRYCAYGTSTHEGVTVIYNNK